MPTLSSTREGSVLDVGGWELRLGRPVDRVFDIPWHSVNSDWTRDLVCDVLAGERNTVAIMDFIGESEYQHILIRTYVEDNMMHTFVAVWDV